MRRGDLVTVALPGHFGNPRPALVIQSDHFSEHPSVAILPITGHLIDAPLFRITLTPDRQNNLQKQSQVMVDKPFTFPKEKVGSVFGHLDNDTMLEVARSLAVFLGFS